jgi:hypothetical protein
VTAPTTPDLRDAWLTEEALEAVKAALSAGLWVLVAGPERCRGTAVSARVIRDLDCDRYLRRFELVGGLEAALADLRPLLLRNNAVLDAGEFEADLAALMPDRPDLVASAMARVGVVVRPEAVFTLDVPDFVLG